MLIAKIGKLSYTGNVTRREILQALQNNEPLNGLANIRVANVQLQEDKGPLDIVLNLEYSRTPAAVYSIEVLGKLQNAWTPKQVEQTGPWLSQLKASQPDKAFALVCPALSPRSQGLCFERNIEFIDLAGNIFINIPGRLLIQRTGRKVPEKISAPFYRDPFSGKASRILRVLLQEPKSWTLREITGELENETQRFQRPDFEFQLSSGFGSRVLRSLEEQVLVVRQLTSLNLDQPVPDQNVEDAVGARGNPIVIPEPKRLLDMWAEKYKERSRWNLRKSFKLPNPFGPDVKSVQAGLSSIYSAQKSVFEPVPVDVVAASTEVQQPPLCYAFTSAAATSVTAPFVEVDVIDLFIADKAAASVLQKAITGTSTGPELRVIPPYDEGVFLYASQIDGVPIVSDIQAYLDLYARGGRDLKQADYLFEKRIAPAWARI